MELKNALVESTSASNQKNQIKARLKKVTELYSQSLLFAGMYQDVLSPSAFAHSDIAQIPLLSSGKLKVRCDLPLNVGDNLMVELEMEGQMQPVKTLAVVVRDLPEIVDGFYASSIRIVGIGKNTHGLLRSFVGAGARAEVSRPLAWA